MFYLVRKEASVCFKKNPATKAQFLKKSLQATQMPLARRSHLFFCN